MALDNQSVTALPGNISKNPTYDSTNLKWRNVVILAGAAVSSFVFGLGIAFQYESLPTTGSATRTEANIADALLTRETRPGGLSGSGYEIVSGVLRDGSIFTKSGAIIVGRLASPSIHMSGGLVSIGGAIRSTNALDVRGTISGSTLQVASNITKGTVSGSTVKASSFTGANLTISAKGTASGNINIFGSDGGGICIYDANGGAWTVLNTSAGVGRFSVPSTGYCPR